MSDSRTTPRAARGRRRAALLGALSVPLLLAGCGGAHAVPYGGALEQAAEDVAAIDDETVLAEPPPFSEGAFPCSRCHAEAPPPAEGEPHYPHAVHIEKGLECADCHEDDGDPAPADRELCDECHAPDDRGSERAVAYFEAYPDGAPPRWDAQVTTAAHDVHAAQDVVCADCHGPTTNAPFGKPGSAVLMERCMSCHEERGATLECEACHEPGTKAPHADVVLRHAENQRGCLDCHDERNRDVLHLANGTPVSFEESYRLCGQCHGPHLRDWRLGIHGKRLGTWDGRHEYLLCAHCHDPHAPQFRKMTPLPPPTPPKEIR